MAEEQSIKDQIDGMCSWALNVKERLGLLDPKTAIPFLRDIDRQGKKLEWRGYGIKKLPDVFTKDLKTEISSDRASAEKIMAVLNKKDFRQKEQLYCKLCGKYAKSMEAMLLRAKEVVEKGPWEPLNFPLFKKEKFFASLFEQFAKRKGHYKTYSNDYSINRIDLSGALLVKANLKGGHLSKADLEGANLEGANLICTTLTQASLRGAILMGADLKLAFLYRADLSEANLFEANLKRTNLERANLDGANLLNVKNLTKEQLHSAENWERASIPENLE